MPAIGWSGDHAGAMAMLGVMARKLGDMSSPGKEARERRAPHKST